MDREKQTDEIAKTMHDGCSIVNATNQCRGEDCLDCGAVTLYEKGYRKDSEVAKEIFDEIENKKRFIQDHAGNIGIVVTLQDITELKKKYTGEKEDE